MPKPAARLGGWAPAEESHGNCSSKISCTLTEFHRHLTVATRTYHNVSLENNCERWVPSNTHHMIKPWKQSWSILPGPKSKDFQTIPNLYIGMGHGMPWGQTWIPEPATPHIQCRLLRHPGLNVFLHSTCPSNMNPFSSQSRHLYIPASFLGGAVFFTHFTVLES